MAAQQLVPLLSLLLCVFLAVPILAALLNPKVLKISKILFATIMLFQMVILTVVYLRSTGAILKFPLLYRAVYPLEISIPGLIYLYVYSLTDSHFKLRDNWPHAAPFLLGVVWYFLVDTLQVSDAGVVDKFELVLDRYLRTGVALLVAVPYLLASHTLVLRFQSMAKMYRSSLVDLRLPWLKFLILLFYTGFSLKLLEILSGPRNSIWPYSGLVINVGLLGLIYFGLKTSMLLTHDSKPKQDPPIAEAKLKAIHQMLLERLRSEKLYLIPQVRLSDIADKLGIKSYLLSEVIGRSLQTNFFDLINSLRIEYAKSLLMSPEHAHLNLLGIAMESGFNSKSVFNDCFKKHAGITPSEFRKRNQKISGLAGQVV